MQLSGDEVTTLYRASNEVESYRDDDDFGLPIRRALASSDIVDRGSYSYVRYVLYRVAAQTGDTDFGDACLVLSERIRTS